MARKGEKLSLETRRKIKENHADMHGSRNGRWTGGRLRKSNGYILVYSPTHPNKDRHGYVLEHRLIVEQAVGRLLDKKEVIHHINGVKDDNRVENLQLLPNSRVHNTITFKGRTSPLKGQFKALPYKDTILKLYDKMKSIRSVESYLRNKSIDISRESIRKVLL